MNDENSPIRHQLYSYTLLTDLIFTADLFLPMYAIAVAAWIDLSCRIVSSFCLDVSSNIDIIEEGAVPDFYAWNKIFSWVRC